MELPASIFLLAHDPQRGRLVGRGSLGYVIRAAALSQLWLSGHLSDQDGKSTVVNRRPPSEPFLAAVLEQIAGSKPRSWRHWIAKDVGAAVGAVSRQLEQQRIIHVESRRILGVFPTTRTTVRDPRIPKRVHRAVVTSARGGLPISRVSALDAALVALVVHGDMSTVLGRADRRDHKDRIEKLAARSGPVPPALRKLLKERQAALSGGG